MKSISELSLSIFKRKKIKEFYELDKSQWFPLSEIKTIQRIKFKKLLEHCVQNVPYYREIAGFDKINELSDMQGIPFLTKEIINGNKDELKAGNIIEKRFVPNSTGGSTGESLKFYSDNTNHIGFGIKMRNNMWTGWKIGERQAMLWGSHYDILKAQELCNTVKNKLIHKILYLSSYDMKETDMAAYRRKLNYYKPQLITAYPSGIFILANFLGKNGLNVYKPKGIICSGETLYDYQREKIESLFACSVYNRYGCREVGNIAHQCDKHHGLHINSEHVIVEVVDRDGKACYPGDIGEVVVTDLDNYVFPFVRYKIGDLAVLSGTRCDCGRELPVLEKVEGRVFDVVVGTNGNMLTGNFWTVLLRTGAKGIKQFQVVQERKGELILKLIIEKSFDNVERNKIIKEIHNKCGNEMSINIQIQDKIPLTTSGKHKFVISRVSPLCKQLKKEAPNRYAEIMRDMKNPVRNKEIGSIFRLIKSNIRLVMYSQSQ